MVLYIDACPREGSRTERLARALLDTLPGDVQKRDLCREPLSPLDGEALALRTARVAAGDFSDPSFRFAKEFAAADVIVIAAPFWDGSFPAILKVYLENIYVQGIVTRFTPEGKVEGLCAAKKLYFVTTAGGPFDPRFGAEYLSYLAECFGIREVETVFAEMLDVDGFDAEAIIAQAERSVRSKDRREENPAK